MEIDMWTLAPSTTTSLMASSVLISSYSQVLYSLIVFLNMKWSYQNVFRLLCFTFFLCFRNNRRRRFSLCYYRYSGLGLGFGLWGRNKILLDCFNNFKKNRNSFFFTFVHCIIGRWPKVAVIYRQWSSWWISHQMEEYSFCICHSPWCRSWSAYIQAWCCVLPLGKLLEWSVD